MPQVTERRRRGEAREAILVAARRAFSAHGYQATSIRAVAADAGVSVTLIYRYFGSKAGLFEGTVVGPGRDFVASFLREWEAAPPAAGRDELVADFVRRLWQFTTEHRGLMAAWSAAMSAETPEVLADGSHGRGLRSLAAMLLDRDDDRSELGEAEAVVTCASALVLSLVTMQDVIVPPLSGLREPGVLLGVVTRFAQAGAAARLLPPAEGV